MLPSSETQAASGAAMDGTCNGSDLQYLSGGATTCQCEEHGLGRPVAPSTRLLSCAECEFVMCARCHASWASRATHDVDHHFAPL